MSQKKGCPHYIGHPGTKNIVENLGAIPAESPLFAGLQTGESAVCFPIQQGRSSRSTDWCTTPHQSVRLEDLSIRVITRIDDRCCTFCEAPMIVGEPHCPRCGAV